MSHHQVSSSQLTLSPAFAGPQSFMNASLTPSPTLEALTVRSSHHHISLSIYINLIVILIVIYISRGYTKDDNESDGCEGSYALSSQEPSPGPILFFLSFLIFNVLLSFLSSFALGFKTYTRVSTLNYRSSDLESSLTRSIIKITPLILGILIEVRHNSSTF